MSPSEDAIATLLAQRPTAELARLPRVNLLPAEIAASRRARQVRGLLTLAVVAAVAAVAGMTYQAQRGIDHAKTQVNVAQAQVAGLQSKVASYGSVQALYARVDAANQTVQSALGGEVLYSKVLTDLALHDPGNIWFTSLSINQQPVPPAPGIAGGIGTITVDGMAFTHDDVANWLDALAREGDLVNATISDSEDTQLGSKTLEKFVGTASLTAGALSRRYDGAGQ